MVQLHEFELKEKLLKAHNCLIALQLLLKVHNCLTDLQLLLKVQLLLMEYKYNQYCKDIHNHLYNLRHNFFL